MNTIESNLCDLEDRISSACIRAGRKRSQITLVAVTKSVDTTAIRVAHGCGIQHFAENRVQEASYKLAQLEDLRPQITWHMIGHLQSNKAKQAASLFDILHSIDSIRLATILNVQATKILPILFQVNVAGEDVKNGFPARDIAQALEEINTLPNLKLIGLMTIAPLVDNPETVRPVFRKLRRLAETLHLEHLSMGMTDDFEVAIEEGSTMVRIGRAIFGERRIACV